MQFCSHGCIVSGDFTILPWSSAAVDFGMNTVLLEPKLVGDRFRREAACAQQTVIGNQFLCTPIHTVRQTVPAGSRLFLGNDHLVNLFFAHRPLDVVGGSFVNN